MTIGIKINVNGNYKVPVSFEQGDHRGALIISGRGHDGPNEQHIPFYHGADAMTLSIGPEEQDNGEAEAA